MEKTDNGGEGSVDNVNFLETVNFPYIVKVMQDISRLLPHHIDKHPGGNIVQMLDNGHIKRRFNGPGNYIGSLPIRISHDAQQVIVDSAEVNLISSQNDWLYSNGIEVHLHKHREQMPRGPLDLTTSVSCYYSPNVGKNALRTKICSLDINRQKMFAGYYAPKLASMTTIRDSGLLTAMKPGDFKKIDKVIGVDQELIRKMGEVIAPSGIEASFTDNPEIESAVGELSSKVNEIMEEIGPLMERLETLTRLEKIEANIPDLNDDAKLAIGVYHIMKVFGVFALNVLRDVDVDLQNFEKWESAITNVKARRERLSAQAGLVAQTG